MDANEFDLFGTAPAREWMASLDRAPDPGDMILDLLAEVSPSRPPPPHAVQIAAWVAIELILVCLGEPPPSVSIAAARSAERVTVTGSMLRAADSSVRALWSIGAPWADAAQQWSVRRAMQWTKDRAKIAQLTHARLPEGPPAPQQLQLITLAGSGMGGVYPCILAEDGHLLLFAPGQLDGARFDAFRGVQELPSPLLRCDLHGTAAGEQHLTEVAQRTVRCTFYEGYTYVRFMDLACTAAREERAGDSWLDSYFVYTEPAYVAEVVTFEEAARHTWRRVLDASKLVEILADFERHGTLEHHFRVPTPSQRRAEMRSRCRGFWERLLRPERLPETSAEEMAVVAFTTMVGAKPTATFEEVLPRAVALAERVRPGRALTGCSAMEELQELAVFRLWLEVGPRGEGSPRGALPEPTAAQWTGAMESVAQMVGPDGALWSLPSDPACRGALLALLHSVLDGLARRGGPPPSHTEWT